MKPYIIFYTMKFLYGLLDGSSFLKSEQFIHSPRALSMNLFPHCKEGLV